MLFILLYAFVLLFLLEPILKTCYYNLLNEDTIFLLLSSYLLNIATAIFFGYYHNITLSFISSFILSIFTIQLVINFKKIFGFFKLTTVPYLLFILYSFVYLLIRFIEII